MSQKDRRLGGQKIDGHFVKPGEIVLVHDGTLLISVVSVGVVVCIWENGGPMAAMAHFVEPRTDDVRRATGRFGNVSIPKLLQMVSESTPSGKIEAQIFGGAIPPRGFGMGEQNIAMARKILSTRNIPIVSEDIGGTKGRKLMFDTKTGHVATIRVHQLRDGDWNL